MKATSILAAATATTIFLFGSCSKSNSDNSAESIAFEKIDMQKSFRLLGTAADFDTEDDLSFGCEADLMLPTALFGNDISTLRDSILSAAFDTCGSPAAEIVETALRKAAAETGYAIADTIMPDSVIREDPSYLSRYDGFSSSQSYIMNLTSERLVYAVTNAIYMPRAAHGMYATRYINYDLIGGRVITLPDLVTEDGLAALPAAIKDKAKEMAGTIGRTDISELPADNNYFINADGDIVFAYQPYEVASYAQGEIQIPIPAYTISDYLTLFGSNFLLGNR